MSQNYDVIIVGGGIVGNSIAAHLANEKLKLAVVNSTDLGTPASIAAAGLLTPFQLHEFENPSLKEFSFKSFEYFLTFYETIHSSTNIDLGFNQAGSLYLIFSNLEIAKKENEIKELKNLNSRITFLNKQEVLKHEPLLTKEMLGAYHFPTEGFINNPKFLKAISLYCLERKVQFINSKIKEINITKNKIDNLLLVNEEKISAKKYILSNGVWANKLLKTIFNTDEDLIKAIKGEILQVGAIHELPLQKIVFCQEGYILPRPATTQFETPSVLIGSTSDEINIENKNAFQNTTSGISLLTGLFQKLIPTLKDVPIINLWAGLRPKTKDNLPIICDCKEIENLYFALGHYRNGILMGPLTGKILKDLILEKDPEHNIEPFRIERLVNNNRDVIHNTSTKIESNPLISNRS